MSRTVPLPALTGRHAPGLSFGQVLPGDTFWAEHPISPEPQLAMCTHSHVPSCVDDGSEDTRIHGVFLRNGKPWGSSRIFGPVESLLPLDARGFELDPYRVGARVYHVGARRMPTGVTVANKTGKTASQALHPVVVIERHREANRTVLRLRPGFNGGALFASPARHVIADPHLLPGVPLAGVWAHQAPALASRERGSA